MNDLFDPNTGAYNPVTDANLSKYCKLNPDTTGTLMNVTTHPISTLLTGYRKELEQVSQGFPTVQSNTLETSAQFQLQNMSSPLFMYQFDLESPGLAGAYLRPDAA